MVLGKKLAIFDWEWVLNSAPREGQKMPRYIVLFISLNMCFGCSKLRLR